MYESNVDDVGYRLVAIYTPVRDDGVEGQPVSASTDSIAVGKYILFFLLSSNVVTINNFHNHQISLFLILAEPDVLTEVKQKLDLGSVKFEVTNYDPTQLAKSFIIIVNISVETYILSYSAQALCDKDRSPKRVHYLFTSFISKYFPNIKKIFHHNSHHDKIFVQCRFLERGVSREESWK